MAVLVDTNVLIDVLTDDPRWAGWSIAELAANSKAGLIINPVIYAELCFGCPSVEFVNNIVRNFALTYREIPRDGLFRAARAIRTYRARRGTKRSVLPDFFIGGHAEADSIPILTRDTKRLRTYFPSVELISP